MFSKARRVKAEYHSRTQTMQLIKETHLCDEIIGCAFDDEDKVVYLCAHQQRSYLWWKRYSKFLQNVAIWESKESIQAYAARNGYFYLSCSDALEDEDKKIHNEGKNSNLSEIKAQLISGSTLKDMEADFYIRHDTLGLDLIIKNRQELSEFEQSLREIKSRIRHDFAGILFTLLFLLS